MMKTLRTTILAATAVVVAGLSPAVAGEFNDAQKKEIGEIVRQYLLEHPDILIEMSRKLEQQQKEAKAARAEAALKAHGKALFSGEGDLVIGNPDGKVKMVEFFDYNCGFCKRSLPDVIRLKDTNPDLKIIIKEFPILGPGSPAEEGRRRQGHRGNPGPQHESCGRAGHQRHTGFRHR